MTKIYLVRHGKAAASWAEDFDPGLDSLGKAQAKATTKALAHLGPLHVMASPLLTKLPAGLPGGVLDCI